MMEETQRITFHFDVPKDQPFRVYPPMLDKKLKGENYVRVYSDALLNIAQDRRLNGACLRVLLSIIGLLEFENQFSISVTELGRIVGLSQPNCDREVKKLVECGYLLPVRKDRQVMVYMLNPEVAFKTKAYKLNGLKMLWNELILTLIPKKESRAA